MSVRFQGLVVQKKAQVQFTFEGKISEDFHQEEIIFEDNMNQVVFNLKDVSMINSCGIREWIKMTQRIDPTVEIIYEFVPPVFVNQMNLVQGLLPENGTVSSFYAPYYDEENDSELKVLIKSSQTVDGKAPVVKTKDGVELEFDGIEANYFKFLKSS